MRVLEWIAEDRVDSEAVADRSVIEAIADAGHESIRILPATSEGDPARPTRETAGLRRLRWNPAQAGWYEAAEVDGICESNRGRGIDLVWARGRSAWRAARRAAVRLDAPLWIELGSIEEAAALSSVPRGVDLLLTVASSAEVEHLRPAVRDHLLRNLADPPLADTPPADTPLIVPPAIAAPARRAIVEDAEDAERAARIVVANTGRRLGSAGVRLIATLIERVLAWNVAAPDPGIATVEMPRRRVELYLEDPLAERVAVRRLLARFGVGVPSAAGPRQSAERSDASAPCSNNRVVRIPPLGRCRGTLGDGDLVFAPQPLLRHRPAVVEAIAAGALFASPPDPELASWFGDGRGGIPLPTRGSGPSRAAAVDEMLQTLASPESRRTLHARASAGLAPMLDPTTRIEAVLSAMARVASPHKLANLRSMASVSTSEPPLP